MTEIIVLPEDTKGRFADNQDCPIARALRRLYPNKSVSVVPRRARIGEVYDKDVIYLKLLNGTYSDVLPFIEGGVGFKVACEVVSKTDWKEIA